MNDLTQESIEFGGGNDYSGVSTSRTLMFRELSQLLASVPADATVDMYKRAVVDENVLLKPSAGTRSKTYAFLRDRFGLDPDIPIFRALRLFWERDEAGRTLMALLVGSFRDPVLRVSLPLILESQPDQAVTSQDFAQAIAAGFPDKLSEKTLKAAGERVSSSYKQSGHLSKKNPPVRQRVSATPGSTALATLLATLEGAGGYALLESAWVRLLDSPDEMVLAEARVASRRGWLEYRQAGDVLEITFHQLLESIGGEM